MKISLLLFIAWLSWQDTDHSNAKNGLAVSGYDIVSYYQSEGPVEGSKDITTKFQGNIYRFYSEENKTTFLKDPEKYIPKYGGWCAYAMGISGDKVKIDPETYKIIDDELYLFYNFWGNNTLKPWNEDETNLKKQADNYWSAIVAPN